VLVKGRVPWGGDVVIPQGQLVTLAEDTFFLSGRTLNYDLPIKAVSLRPGTVLPARATLAADLELPAGTILGGAVRDAQGNVVQAAGTVLSQPLTLASGMQLDAGNRLAGGASVAAMTWPAGVPLPQTGTSVETAPGVYLANALALRKGAVIPSETVVKLPDDAVMVSLRPGDASGNQGRNWALAPMLPEGSQSWSVRLVSGADTQAADTRALQAHGKQASMLLADTHYGLVSTNVLLPGTGLPGEYVVGGGFAGNHRHRARHADRPGPMGRRARGQEPQRPGVWLAGRQGQGRHAPGVQDAAAAGPAAAFQRAAHRHR